MTATTRARAAAPDRVADPRPDLTVVRRRRARRSMLTRLGTVMLFSLFVSVLGVVVFQTLRVQNQAKLDEINKRIADEEDAARVLRLKIADAQAPDRIADVARNRLGMVPPNDIAYLQPKPDDEAKAAWDPQKEPLPAPPTTTPPATTPPATTPPATTPATTVPPAAARSAKNGTQPTGVANRSAATTNTTTKATTNTTTKTATRTGTGTRTATGTGTRTATGTGTRTGTGTAVPTTTRPGPTGPTTITEPSDPRR